MVRNEILVGHVLDKLGELADRSVHCVITSPPYWGLRNYGIEPQTWGGEKSCVHEWADEAYVRRVNDSKDGSKQATNKGSRNRDVPIRHGTCVRCGAWRGDLGLEPTFELFLEHMVAVFREVRRVLRDDGLAFVNFGDAYASGKGSCLNPGGGENSLGKMWKDQGVHHLSRSTVTSLRESGLKPKDLVGMPWAVAFALRADGWWLRSDIVWSKPNPMPESVQDRPTKSHEYVFMLSKSPRYFSDFEAIRESADPAPMKMPDGWGDNAVEGPGGHGNFHAAGRRAGRKTGEVTETKNVRTVWSIATESFGCEYCRACKRFYWPTEYRALEKVKVGADTVRRCRCGSLEDWLSHFATFPRALVARCLLSSTSEAGVCSRCGAPWVRVVDVSYENVGNRTSNGERSAQLRHGISAGYDVRLERRASTAGWRPWCGCGTDLQDGDLDIIETPVGDRAAWIEEEGLDDDPTMETGRAGMNRPRNPDAGYRTMTRWTQRAIAEQLRTSEHRATMEAEAGVEAFAHYLRTDLAGARPPDPDLLEKWVAAGWVTIEPVPLPKDPPPRSRPVVLDPFMGSGTVALVALRAGRDFVGIELNPEYAEIARRRIEYDLAQGRLA